MSTITSPIIPSPYKKGLVLKALFTPEHSSPQEAPIPLLLTFTSTFEPTMSIVSTVRVSFPGLSPGALGPRWFPSSLVLKLFDRRFSPTLRAGARARQWAVELENSMQALMGSSKAPKVSGAYATDSWRLATILAATTMATPPTPLSPPSPALSSLKADNGNNSDNNDSHDGSSGSGSTTSSSSSSSSNNASISNALADPLDWSPELREAYIDDKTRCQLASELEVYRRLEPLQGKSVPRLYGTIACLVLGMEVEGILMEDLGRKAITLGEVSHRNTKQWLALQSLPGAAKRGANRWQLLGEEVIHILREIGDYGVVNRDVRLSNGMVVLGVGGVRVVMIDFAQARVRREGEEEDAWRKCRRHYDEEGTLGRGLERVLGGSYVYVDERRHWEEGDDPREDVRAYTY